MKTVGILLLFGLCVAIGMRAAASKSARYEQIAELIRDLRIFSDLIESGQSSLLRIAEEHNGALFAVLREYLALRNATNPEAESAKNAIAKNGIAGPEGQSLQSFLEGLSVASSSAIRTRIAYLSESLNEAQKAAAESAKQAKTIRAVGVLIGAGICILLL